MKITKREFQIICRELSKPQDFICLDQQTFLKANLVGMEMASKGVPVYAKIIRKAGICFT